MFYIEQSSKLTISIEPSKHNSQYNTNKVPIQTRSATYFIALFPLINHREPFCRKQNSITRPSADREFWLSLKPENNYDTYVSIYNGSSGDCHYMLRREGTRGEKLVRLSQYPHLYPRLYVGRNQYIRHRRRYKPRQSKPGSDGTRIGLQLRLNYMKYVGNQSGRSHFRKGGRRTGSMGGRHTILRVWQNEKCRRNRRDHR